MNLLLLQKKQKKNEDYTGIIRYIRHTVKALESSFCILECKEGAYEPLSPEGSSIEDVFLQLVRLGIGIKTNASISGIVKWDEVETLAEQQGLSAILLDGVETLTEEHRPKEEFLLQWIGRVIQDESFFSLQKEVAVDMAKLFHRNGIKTYVLKGAVVSECYPKPNHRVSVDIDCYLLPEKSNFDAWSLGNDLIQAKGFRVNTEFYKNSSFEISGVNIENHQFLTPFRGNKRLAEFERLLQIYMSRDKGENVMEGTYLYRPPVMVTSLFLIEHAYSHFLHTGLTWRFVLDWALFRKKHVSEIDWNTFNALIDEFGFRKFYDSFYRIGRYLFGELTETNLTNSDKRMLSDIWAPLDLHETVHGIKGKLSMVGNTWRARWKYDYFAEISMIHALWIQVKAFLFIKHPKI